MSERCEDTVITVLYFVTTITAEFCSFGKFTAAIWTELEIASQLETAITAIINSRLDILTFRSYIRLN